MAGYNQWHFKEIDSCLLRQQLTVFENWRIEPKSLQQHSPSTNDFPKSMCPIEDMVAPKKNCLGAADEAQTRERASSSYCRRVIFWPTF